MAHYSIMIKLLAVLSFTYCAASVAVSNPIVVDIQKSATSSSTASTSNVTTSRLNTLSASLTQAGDRSLYWINITVGSPGQQQSLQLDTGSRRVWIPATGSSICSNSLVDCGTLGSFDSGDSSTYNDAGSTDTITYSDGTSVSGEVFYDTFHIGGQAITQQVGLLGTSGSGVHEGVLGVGFPASAPTINHNLAAQGIIGSNRYSIYLNSLQAGSGSIKFGGIDPSKFIAPLLRVPIIGTDQPTIALTRVATLENLIPTVQTGSGFSEPAILDTGTTLTVLPQSLVDSINAAFGSQYYPGNTNGVTIIPCSASGGGLSINFHFGRALTGPTINVDISQLVLQGLGTLNGVQMCQFGLYGSDGSFPTTLGDTFLRSAYVLYDLDREVIGLAQAIDS